MSDDEYDSKTGMSREVTKQNRMVYRKTPNPKDFSRCRAPKLSMWISYKTRNINNFQADSYFLFQKLKMKISAFFLAATLASVMAASSHVQEPALEARAACWNRSSCGRAWSGKCEDYCKPYKFSHMATTDCGWLAKRCCCKT
ncbi:hypothetical protein H9L39_17310 [Fusarium oxysporum f. sp. albedinis]|nr:hypothetical protein H9L39_19644 [Fusarium oxysporum f. sp. albedinis]KAK2469731.1 hypothetical protein H9L39_18546 [Fusarium oxysporum f. sp. albedinis]KAK2471079.1 hypothetical protein H9L39_17310 [Fusarium oxysporum f. sp. albedinis]